MNEDIFIKIVWKRDIFFHLQRGKLNETKCINDDPLIILANTAVNSAPEQKSTISRAMFCRTHPQNTCQMQTSMFPADLRSPSLWNWEIGMFDKVPEWVFSTLKFENHHSTAHGLVSRWHFWIAWQNSEFHAYWKCICASSSKENHYAGPALHLGSFLL